MAKLAESAIDIRKERDARGVQRFEVEITWESASSGDVAELELKHLGAVCALVAVSVWDDSGAMASRQPDVYEGASGQSSTPADARKVYVATSTVVADQIGNYNLGPAGAPCRLSSTRSLYVRLQPNTGSDNNASMLLVFVPLAVG